MSFPSSERASTANRQGKTEFSAVADQRVSPKARPPTGRLGRGSWFLASARQRMIVAMLVSAALWGMTTWAMQWW